MSKDSNKSQLNDVNEDIASTMSNEDIKALQEKILRSRGFTDRDIQNIL